MAYFTDDPDTEPRWRQIQIAVKRSRVRQGTANRFIQEKMWKTNVKQGGTLQEAGWTEQTGRQTGISTHSPLLSSFKSGIWVENKRSLSEPSFVQTLGLVALRAPWSVWAHVTIATTMYRSVSTKALGIELWLRHIVSTKYNKSINKWINGTTSCESLFAPRTPFLYPSTVDSIYKKYLCSHHYGTEKKKGYGLICK